MNLKATAIIITILFLRSEYGYLKKINGPASGCIPQQKDSVAFNYIASHVSDNDIIIFTKPRALTLFTNKKSMNVSWQISQQANKKVFDSIHVKYMLVVNGLDDDYFKTYLREVQHPVDSVAISSGYMLYSLR